MSRQSIFIVVVVLALAGACSYGKRGRPVSDPSSLRVTKSGAVVGFVGEYGSHAWLGIPYAKPPVGELRWRAPQPPTAWSGTRAALEFGEPCVQLASPFGGVTTAKAGAPVGSEDCLFMNVWAPQLPQSAAATKEKLPVMLWIHGGGNSIGEGGFYNGGNLAATQRLIVLTFNYRLGPFGWFHHAALRGEGTSAVEGSGNFGTLDMIHALKWVRDNISEFGGDPGNVTIFGESAGGQNVYQMLVSPQAKGLFHRAIVQSGSIRFDTVAEAENFTDDAEPGDPQSSNETLLHMLVTDGKAADRSGARVLLDSMSAADVARYLRGKDKYEFLGAYPQYQGTGMTRVPKPFRDGVVLPSEDPMQVLRSGQYTQVPVMLGTNRDENKVFMFGDPRRVRLMLWMIPRVHDQRTYDLSAEYLAKAWKASGADEPAAVMRQVQGPSVYVYRFDWDEEPTILGADLSQLLGAAHGFEIPFVFGHFDLGKEGNQIFTKENEAGRRALAAQMMSYWAEFAYNGAPGRGRDGKLAEWAAFDPSSPTAPKFIVLDTTAGGGLRMASDTVSNAALIDALAIDARFKEPVERCRVYRELADWDRSVTRDQYATIAACTPYPFDAYPWEG